MGESGHLGSSVDVPDILDPIFLVIVTKQAFFSSQCDNDFLCNVIMTFS